MIKREDIQTSPSTKAMRPLRTYVLIGVCTVMLVSGFFFAARQHFSSMDYGMKNSRLRKQVDQLEAEKRRLLLAKEVSLSPAEIKKAATKVGMMGPSKNAIAEPEELVRAKATPDKNAEAKPLVIKTAAVSAAPQSEATTTYKKTDKVGREIKKTLSTE